MKRSDYTDQLFDCCLTVSSQQLWDGVTGVSNAGKKKGRGKRVGRKKATDLNRGQRLGVGKQNSLLYVTRVFLSVQCTAKFCIIGMANEYNS